MSAQSAWRIARRRPILALAALLVLLAAASAPVRGATTPAARAALAERLDRLLAATYPAAEPGAAVLVQKDGEVILRRGYGMASLELGVPIRPEMVFRIGSVTKQFTAMAILQLAGEGRLSLDDDISRLLPGYPTHGQRITVEHLLTHTSGIESYTSLPDWQQAALLGLSVPRMIDRFKDRPLLFAPGERWLYDNSGYLLLGAILEKVTGKDYAGWMAEHLFRPLGLAHTLCADAATIVPGRVAGYQGSSGHYVNAPSFSKSPQYADGSMVSSVDDLARWDRALTAGRLARKDLLERMFTPYRLKDGRSTNYGYGWEIWSYQGHRVIEHDGVVNGFQADILRMPEERLLVVILSNSLDHQPPPSTLAIEIAGLAIGEPVAERKTVHLAPEILDRYVGVYRVDASTVRLVTREGGRLFTQRSNYPKLEILPAALDDFFYKDTMDRLHFATDAAGKITGMVLDRRLGGIELAARTAEPPPAEEKGAAHRR